MKCELPEFILQDILLLIGLKALRLNLCSSPATISGAWFSGTAGSSRHFPGDLLVDRIHLLVYDFLSPDTREVSKAFIAEASLLRKQAPSVAPTTA
jgi:hypothetical protein